MLSGFSVSGTFDNSIVVRKGPELRGAAGIALDKHYRRPFDSGPLRCGGSRMRETVPGYEDYEADDQGQIWRVAFRVPGLSERKLTQYVTPSGYLRVTLAIKGGEKVEKVHKLVGLAFHGPRKDGQQMRHLDGNKTNNTPGNLAWGTSEENTADKFIHNTLARMPGEANPSHKLTTIDVIAIRRMHSNGQSSVDLARQFGMSQSMIRYIISHRRWAHVS